MFKSRILNLPISSLRQMLENDGHRIKKGRVVMDELLFTTDPYNDSYKKGETFSAGLQDGSDYILIDRDGDEHYIGLAGLCARAEQSSKHLFDRRRPTVRFCSTAEEHLLESEGGIKILTSYGPGPTFIASFAYYPQGVNKLQLDCFSVPARIFTNSDLKQVNTTRSTDYKEVALAIEREVSRYGSRIEGQCVVSYDLSGSYSFSMLDVVSIGDGDVAHLTYAERQDIFIDDHKSNTRSECSGNILLVYRDVLGRLDPEFVLAPLYRRYYFHVLSASKDETHIMFRLGFKGGVEVLRLKVRIDQLKSDALRSVTTCRSLSVVSTLITRENVDVVSIQRCASTTVKTLERLMQS